jgi:hypothetical protein
VAEKSRREMLILISHEREETLRLVSYLKRKLSCEEKS